MPSPPPIDDDTPPQWADVYGADARGVDGEDPNGHRDRAQRDGSQGDGAEGEGSAGSDPPAEAGGAFAGPASANQRYDLTWSTLFVLLTLLGIAPIWVTDLLPLLDAASHQHLIRLIHEYDSNALFQAHYEPVRAIVPYLTYYKAVDWLMFLVDVETANRVVLSLCLAALPMAAASLLRALGHNRWLVLGIFPWMLNSDFFMGFFNYLLSIPLFLWLLAAHVRLLRRPGWRQAVAVAGLTVLLALTHYLLWSIALLLLPLLGLVFGTRRNGWRGALLLVRESLLVLPSVLVLLPWFLSYFVLAADARTPDQAAIAGTTLGQRLARLYSGQHLGPIDDVRQLFGRMFDSFAPQTSEHLPAVADLILRRQGEMASFLWLCGLGLWLIGAAKSAPPVTSTEGGANGQEVRGGSYIGWVLAAITAAYFLLPQHLARPIYLYGVDFRLVEVIGILAVLALPVCPLLPPVQVRLRVWVGTSLMVLVAVLMPLHTAGTFLLVRTEYGSIREAFGSIPPNRNVLTLRMKRNSRWLREMMFSNIGEYYAVFQGGYVPYSFADSSSKPIITRTEASLPAPTWFDHNTFSVDAHGKYYEYIAIYRDLEERPGAWERSLAHWHRVYQRDYWQVYRNPEVAAWPPPTPAEIATSEAEGLILQWAMERIGLAPQGTLPAELVPVLEHLVDRLHAAGVAEWAPPRPRVEASPGATEGARSRRRRRPIDPSAAGDAAVDPGRDPGARPDPNEAGAGEERARMGYRRGPQPPSEEGEAIGPGGSPPQRREPEPPAPETPPGPERGGAADPARQEGSAAMPPASALMPTLPSRLPVFQRAFGRFPSVGPPIEAPNPGGRPASGGDLGPPEPALRRPAVPTWFDPFAALGAEAPRESPPGRVPTAR